MKFRLSMKKYKTFPSMEWGPNGGYCCDIYFDGVKQGYFHQAGDGGCFDYSKDYKNPKAMSEKELGDYVKEYLKENKNARVIANYHLDDLEYVDLETGVNLLAALNDYKKMFNKRNKQGYTHFCLVSQEPAPLREKNYQLEVEFTSFWTKPIPAHLIEETVRKKGWDGPYIQLHYTSYEELLEKYF